MTVRPALVVGILLAAASYAATKEWQWQVEVPLLPVSSLERTGTWYTEAVTVQPEQIFQD